MGIRLLALILVLAMLPVAPVSAAGEDVVIVLDPGHGGMDSGTVEKYDGVEVWESELNLQIAGYCRDYLEENYENVQVYLTRESDFLSLNQNRILFFVSQKKYYIFVPLKNIVL